MHSTGLRHARVQDMRPTKVPCSVDVAEDGDPVVGRVAAVDQVAEDRQTLRRGEPLAPRAPTPPDRVKRLATPKIDPLQPTVCHLAHHQVVVARAHTRRAFELAWRLAVRSEGAHCTPLQIQQP